MVSGEQMRESEFQRAIEVALNRPGRSTRAWRQNAGRLRVVDRSGARWVMGAPIGAADLSGLVRPEGWRLEVEVKTGTKLRPQQRKWKKFIESFGGIYVLCSYNKKLSAEENVLVAIQTIDQAVAERREQ